MGTVSKVMAGCFSMAAFAVAIIAGLAGGNSAVLVLGRALIAMILCYPIGLIVGFVCARVMTLHGKEYERDHPVPRGEEEKPDQTDAANAEAEKQESEEVLVV